MREVTMYMTNAGTVWPTKGEAVEAEELERSIAILEQIEGVYWNDRDTRYVAKLILDKGYMLIPRCAAE